MKQYFLSLSTITILFFQGCTTTGGAFTGGALGALAGQAIGADTEATLIGAGIGAMAGAITADHVNHERARSYDQGYSDGYYNAPAPPPPPVIERSYYHPAPKHYHDQRNIHYRPRHRVIVVPPPPPPPGSVIYYPY